ncbi:MAG: carbohydrate kinase [Tidjanibacter sp.]|nr:carbohydrate kinase [Tidjanibacter sp.]
MTQTKKIVVGMGELLFDVFPTGKKIGGAPVNFAYHVGQLGIESLAISAVGNDELGREIMDILQEKRINNIVPLVAEPTGTVQVTLDEKGVPSYEICEGVAWDNIPCNKELVEVAKSCCAFCFGSLAQRAEQSRNAINLFLDSMDSGDDALRIFDINLRQAFYSREIIEESLKKSNVLKINDDEFRTVGNMLGYDGEDFERGSRLLMERYGLKMVILTCGEIGSHIFYEGGSSFLPTPKVEIADTVGAGDSFTAAFVASLLSGKSIEESHRKAVEVSAYVCTQSGAMPIIPEELKA